MISVTLDLVGALQVVAAVTVFWSVWSNVRSNREMAVAIRSLTARVDELAADVDALFGEPDDDPDDGHEPGALTEDADAVGQVLPLRRVS